MMRITYFAIAAMVLAGLAIPAGDARARETQTAPAVAGGPEACRDCHGELFARYEKNVHAGQAAQRRMAGRSGCEICHGSAAAHVEDPANKAGLVTFASGNEKESIAACLSCHGADRRAGAFDRSEHGRHRIACTQCHASPHAETSVRLRRSATTGAEGTAELGSHLRRDGVDLCLDCHSELRGRFSMPNRHPVREKALTCVECHDPHRSEPSDARARNGRCLSCHEDIRGPWPFEHAPVAEDCASCHEPHGSVAPGLLKTAQPFLCLSCHSLPDDRHGAEIGGSQFSRAVYGRCTSCHGAIHGSHEDRHLRK